MFVCGDTKNDRRLLIGRDTIIAFGESLDDYTLIHEIHLLRIISNFQFNRNDGARNLSKFFFHSPIHRIVDFFSSISLLNAYRFWLNFDVTAPVIKYRQ